MYSVKVLDLELGPRPICGGVGEAAVAARRPLEAVMKNLPARSLAGGGGRRPCGQWRFCGTSRWKVWRI